MAINTSSLTPVDRLIMLLSAEGSVQNDSRMRHFLELDMQMQIHVW